MKIFVNQSFLALRLWLHTALTLSVAATLVSLVANVYAFAIVLVFSVPFSLVVSIPALIILVIALPLINRTSNTVNEKIQLLTISCFFLCIIYGCLAGFVFATVEHPRPSYLLCMAAGSGILITCNLPALLINRRRITAYFTNDRKSLSEHFTSKTNQHMETTTTEQQPVNENANKVLVKGLITGVLILVMLIPTLFVSNLVEEREQRQKEIVNEVSSKWASEQRISGPYVSVPYTEFHNASDGRVLSTVRNLVLLPENLGVNGKLIPEKAHRSIYNVLLYRSTLQVKGNFNIKLPDDIQAANIDFTKARICLGITDFRGIEEKISLRFGNSLYSLSPGLPTKEVDETGLSAPVALTVADLEKPIAFATTIRIKGSSQLRFLPLSANSSFEISSLWKDPSFNGNSLPSYRKVNDSGFTARWNFNEANLPFGTTIREGSRLLSGTTGFGVNMLQPADHYAKTLRSVKYAILFIGLTFALFFIIELMQRRPVHPVQYILVGLALVIFYTLLLSISEFVAFDIAYMAAAVATVSLITLYAKGHFASWKVASVFGAVLGSLYGFIFILIRLEDTALLVGSIGLFIVLALVMYASRRINWYGYQAKPSL